MDDEERKRLVRQIEREIYLSHLRGELPPNFHKTLLILQSMGIDPDDLLDNAFFKFELLGILAESGIAEPVESGNLDLSRKIVLDATTRQQVVEFPAKGLLSFTVNGDSMVGAGINPGDIVLVGEEPFESGAVCVVQVEDTYFVKRVERTKTGFRLISENKKYPPVEIQSNVEFQIIGKVKYVLRKVE